MKIKVTPSILAADFSKLGEQVSEAIAAGADAIHVDVMDGFFVPPLTFGPMIVSSIHPICAAAGVPIDVHLMIEKPERLIPDFASAGADLIVVHVETCPHLYNTIQQIKSIGVQAGITLNPATPLVTVEEILPEVSHVLIMSVSPGYGGQEFIPASLARVTRLHNKIQSAGLGPIDIAIDGGVSLENIAQIVAAGANVLVVGSAVFRGQQSIAANIARLRQAAEIPAQ